MLGHFLVTCPVRWPFFFFLCYRASLMRSGGRVLRIIRTVWRSTAKILASLCLLSLPHLHANPTGTTGPARILRILPRLPPSQPTHHLSRAKCGGLFPHPFRSFSLCSFLHICMILARQYALNVPFPKGDAVVCMSCQNCQSLWFPLLSSHWISLSHRHF